MADTVDRQKDDAVRGCKNKAIRGASKKENTIAYWKRCLSQSFYFAALPGLDPKQSPRTFDNRASLYEIQRLDGSVSTDKTLVSRFRQHTEAMRFLAAMRIDFGLVDDKATLKAQIIRVEGGVGDGAVSQ